MAMAANNAKARLANEFIKKIKTLMLDLVERSPGDHKVLGVQRKLIVATDLAPLDILEKVGAKLAHFNESIFSEDPQEWKKFFEVDAGARKFESDLPAGDDDRTLAEYVIGRVQELLRTMGDRDQLVYLEKVRNLLDLYLEYHASG